MKTNLTLKVGSFYFLSSVNLMRNSAAEVDLSVLTEAELKGLKAYVKAGSIQSSESISEYNLPGTVVATELAVEEEVKEATTAPEDSKEPTEGEPEAIEVQEEATKETPAVDYEEFTAKELKTLIKERDLTTKATSKRDLVAFLEEEDKNAE